MIITEMLPRDLEELHVLRMIGPCTSKFGLKVVIGIEPEPSQSAPPSLLSPRRARVSKWASIFSVSL